MVCTGMTCINKLKEKLKEEKIDGFLITNEVNIHYVTGFTGAESILLVTSEGDYLFTDFRYVEQASQDIPWTKVIEKKVSLIRTICGKLKRLNIKKLYVESLYLTLEQYNEIASKGNGKGIRVIPTRGVVETYRKRKTQEELGKIRTAIDIAERAYYGVPCKK